MKKIFSLLFLVSLVFALTACNKPEKKDDDTIEISYASWGNQEFEQKMIDAFMVANPDIKVTLRTDITGTGAEFTGNLITQGLAGTAPDVFAIDNVPTAMANGLTYDIAELWNNDPDTDKIYDNIANTAVYNGVRYAAPSYQFIEGIFINLTLLDTLNLQKPSKDWKYTDLVALAKQATDQNNYIFGLEGMGGNIDFDARIPQQNDVNLGYHTFDGTKFDFTNQQWIDAFKLKQELDAYGVQPSFTEDELVAEFGSATAWPWIEGNVLMNIQGSWMLPTYITEFEKNEYELGFWPYPGGDAGQRIPTILDYMCVSASTEYPEEAYKLLKWMSFGEDGWMARLEIMEEMDMPLNGLPVGDYPAVWTKVEEMAGDIEGLSENIALLDNSVPDVDKWLPGYKDFWQWIFEPIHGTNDAGEDIDYITYINENNVDPAVFAPIWEEKLNKSVEDALAELGVTLEE